MAIGRVFIEEGCIVCRACEVACGAVFDVKETGCEVRRGVKLEPLEKHIREAAAICPVKVIRVTTPGKRRS
jgi:ferredoxin